MNGLLSRKYYIFIVWKNNYIFGVHLINRLGNVLGARVHCLPALDYFIRAEAGK